MTVASSSHKARVVILGGGFGGVYTAIALESLLKDKSEVEIVLVNRENYFVFQPMLPEIISGSIGILDTVSPIRRLVPRTSLFVRDVESIDIASRTVILSHGFRPRPHELHYDHLVLALGNVTDFRGMPGLPEHALPFKNLADAIYLRNHLIHVLEEAAIETDPQLREQLLTFVVAGGGFSGVEVVAELNDFVRRAARHYAGIRPEEIRVVLLHSGEMILDKELTKELSLYAGKILKKRGVEIRFKSRLRTASPDSAVLSNGDRIPTKTLVSTVPSMPHPLVETLPLPKDKGKIKTDLLLQVEGTTDVWAIGDCALIPNPSGKGFAPPTAQHAIRQANTAARNIVASLFGGKTKKYDFEGLGKMGALGYRNAVMEIFGIKQSGFLAWLVWRSIYWWKLPGFDRKLKVGLAWFLDLLVAPEIVQLKLGASQGVTQAHFEPGELVFHQGELGDCLYIILGGEAEVVRTEHGAERVLARLGPGEYFGEMALLNEKTRGASIRCITAMDVLTLRKGDFKALVANLPDLRKGFEGVMEKRMSQLQNYFKDPSHK
jgi:NADH dehydrogenase